MTTARPALSTMLDEAIDIAVMAHRGQRRRYTGEPYIAHPLAVMTIVRGATDDPVALAAAILHDVPEDADGGERPGCWLRLIADTCSLDVAEGVQTLSDNCPRHAGNRAARKAAICRKLADAPGWVQTIKVADMIDNLPSIVEHDPKFAPVYVQEARNLLDVLARGDDRLRSRAGDVLEIAEITVESRSWG